MVRRRLATDSDTLRDGFSAVREDLDVPLEFPLEVVEEATSRAAAGPPGGHEDMTAVSFATLDPVGSMDLDQAFHLERRGSGFRVRYAIADVAAWVEPGGAVDTEARRRGVTLYSPDARTPLHPPVLSEGAASLLPDSVCPAVVWTVDLDSTGEQVDVDLRRALVRSRRRLDYESVQAEIDGASDDEQLVLLREVGERRLALEEARGGMSLPVPDQEVVRDGEGWALVYREPLLSEDWNAQLSLLTGMCAARIMLDGGVGVLRTMPDADPRDVSRLRRVARALRIDWPESETYEDLLDRVTGATSREAAFLDEASVLFRGASYTVVDGVPPALTTHAAVAAPYAHVTAPLRRLVDRFATEACLALVRGEDVSDWVVSALPTLPDAMADASRRANALERGCIDLVEAVVLQPRVGDVFDAVVVDVHEKNGGTVMLTDPAVRARCDGDLDLGADVRVRLSDASPERREVRFVLA